MSVDTDKRGTESWRKRNLQALNQYVARATEPNRKERRRAAALAKNAGAEPTKR